MAMMNESFKAKEDALDQEDSQSQQKLQSLQQEIERMRDETSDLERRREQSSTENTALRVSLHPKHQDVLLNIPFTRQRWIEH